MSGRKAARGVTADYTRRVAGRVNGRTAAASVDSHVGRVRGLMTTGRRTVARALLPPLIAAIDEGHDTPDIHDAQALMVQSR